MLSPITPYNDHYHNDLDGSVSSTMSRSARRGPWLPEEDQTLLQLVRSQGANNWVRISQQIQHRSPKQCRERYHQNLKPSLKHDPISAHEGEMIERLVQEMGKRWAEIARRLGNRSDNAVKNWWNGSVNRRRRNPSHHTTTTGFKQVGSRLQPVPFTLPPDQSYLQRAQPATASRHGTRSALSQDSKEFTRPQRPIQLQEPPLEHLKTHPVTAAAAGFEHNATAISSSRFNPGRSTTTTRYENIPSAAYVHENRPALPPIRAASCHLERSNLGMECSPISPALSDTSQRYPPSLVPDDQSSYSVSPGTVATPYLSDPSPSDGTIWSDYYTQAQKGRNSGLYKHMYNSNSYSGQDNRTTTDSRPPPHRPQIYNMPLSASEDRYKDVRMNVSTLLQ